MSADKTTPMLGKLIEPGQQRDAIHIAVAPVVAAERLAPGQHIGFIDGSKELVGASPTPLGIVDPFLTFDVRTGERFWMFLYPNTITSLRHRWEHPAFEDAVADPAANGPVDASRQWIEDMAERCGVSYRKMMAAAAAWQASTELSDRWGAYLNMGDDESYKDEFCGSEEEFWKHYEIVTGEKVKDHSGSFFTCSC